MFQQNPSIPMTKMHITDMKTFRFRVANLNVIGKHDTAMQCTVLDSNHFVGNL